MMLIMCVIRWSEQEDGGWKCNILNCRCRQVMFISSFQQQKQKRLRRKRWSHYLFKEGHGSLGNASEIVGQEKLAKDALKTLDVMLNEYSWKILSTKFMFFLTLKLGCQASTHIQVIDLWRSRKMGDLQWSVGVMPQYYKKPLIQIAENLGLVNSFSWSGTGAKYILPLTSLVILSKSLIPGFLICKMAAHPSSFLCNSCSWGTMISLSGGVMTYVCNPSIWKAKTRGL